MTLRVRANWAIILSRRFVSHFPKAILMDCSFDVLDFFFEKHFALFLHEKVSLTVCPNDKMLIIFSVA